MSSPPSPVTKPHGVIIAGGRGARLKLGPKHAVMLAGRSLLSHARARFAPQVDKLAFNLNDPSPGEALGLTILADRGAERGGPMMGVLAALEWAVREGARNVATVPVDAPFLPTDLVARLVAQGGGQTAFAVCGENAHYICAVWDTRLMDAILSLVDEEGIRRVEHILDAIDAVRVDFSDCAPHAFLNINTREDLALGERILAGP